MMMMNRDTDKEWVHSWTIFPVGIWKIKLENLGF